MSTTDDFRGSGLTFPDGFVFGSATASYQIEGAVDEDGRGPSIWDTFSHTPGKVQAGDTGDVAVDFYHRVDEDLDLMARLGLGAYRLSIAWPRVIPAGTGEVNEAGLDFYERVVDGLIGRGITPVVTLYHWDLPQPLEDRGGWTNRETAYAFAEFARVVGARLGDRVAVWTTLNEPWCSAYLGYAAGEHAPGHRNELEALRAVHHLNLAHGLGLSALREVVTKTDARFSLTLNLQAVRADSDSPEDLDAKRQIETLSNRAFTEPVLRGRYPEDIFEDTRAITDWAFVQPGDLELIHQPLDVLGINYYSTARVKRSAEPHETTGTPFPGATRVDFVEQPGPYTAMGWNIEPAGLLELLTWVHETYPEIELMVTENGAAFDDEVIVTDAVKAVHDPERIDYLRRHFTAAHRAIEAGVPLTGYFVWSLMDNFEWAFGYSKRFGIVYVDYETQERIPKDSALWYARLASAGVLPD